MTTEHLRQLQNSFKEYFRPNNNKNNWLRNLFIVLLQTEESITVPYVYVGKADRNRLSEVGTDWMLGLGSELILLCLPRWSGELIEYAGR
jgi:hypothetical protein